jgi:hypothetical protein
MLAGLFAEVEVSAGTRRFWSSRTAAPCATTSLGKGVSPEREQLAAESVAMPLRVNKRGALLFARKR